MHDDAMHSEVRQDRDELDLLLDAALATYANPGPSTGLTNRILASTTRVDSRRASRMHWLPWAIPALAAFLLFAVFLMHRNAAPHEKSSVAARLPSQRPSISSPSPDVASAQTPPPPRSVLLRPARATAPEQSPLPRLEVFPTPTPLSAEEQALVALVNRNPDIRRSMVPGQKQAMEPVRIAAIQIPPLNPPDNGGN